MKILFLDQEMNWWFADQYPKCDLPDRIVGTRFSFLQTHKLLENWRAFFCCCDNRSAASFTTLCRPSNLDFFIKLWTAMQEHSKPRFSFQILYELQPFSLKSFSMTAFCWLKPSCCAAWLGELWKVRAKTSNYNQLWFALQWLLALSRLFTRQRQKKIN